MARRKPLPPPGASDVLVLPADLPRGRDRADWLRSHGVDPADWAAVYPVLRATAAASGTPLALERAAQRHAHHRKEHP